MERLTPARIAKFQKLLWDFFAEHQRAMPWRVVEADDNFAAYKILVSEMMLQQTQVVRVIPKFEEFLNTFPTLESLAAASLGTVLEVWQGLGYNRRAKFLHDAAQALIAKNKPWQYEDLIALTGIGPNTAAAIVTYAYNQPTLFIETNIRTVVIHHFFKDQTNIADRDILALLDQTLDRTQPRVFYWALMDYGAYLKTTTGNLAKHSKHYARQPAFAGSRRAIRGQVIRLLAGGEQSLSAFKLHIQDERLAAVLKDLTHEGLIIRCRQKFDLA